MALACLGPAAGSMHKQGGDRGAASNMALAAGK